MPSGFGTQPGLEQRAGQRESRIVPRNLSPSTHQQARRGECSDTGPQFFEPNRGGSDSRELGGPLDDLARWMKTRWHHRLSAIATQLDQRAFMLSRRGYFVVRIGEAPGFKTAWSYEVKPV